MCALNSKIIMTDSMTPVLQSLFDPYYILDIDPTSKRVWTITGLADRSARDLKYWEGFYKGVKGGGNMRE